MHLLGVLVLVGLLSRQVRQGKLAVDLEWELEVDITGEQKDKQTVLTTLNTMLGIILNPAYAGNQQAQMVVGKILQQTGVVSPIELSTAPAPQPLPQPVDAGNAVGLPAQPTQ